jgi:hypothetical protein
MGYIVLLPKVIRKNGDSAAWFFGRENHENRICGDSATVQRVLWQGY